MNETEARALVEAHGAAVVGGDTDHVVGDVAEPNLDAVFAAAADMPTDVEKANVESVSLEADVIVAVTRYAGSGSELRLETKWESVEGRHRIVAARAL